MFRKETVFEGYFAAYYESSFLAKEPEYSREGKAWDRTRAWFREYLENLLTSKPSKYVIGFDDILPKQVYEKLLNNPNTKFHFRIVVEAE